MNLQLEKLSTKDTMLISLYSQYVETMIKWSDEELDEELIISFESFKNDFLLNIMASELDE